MAGNLERLCKDRKLVEELILDYACKNYMGDIIKAVINHSGPHMLSTGHTSLPHLRVVAATVLLIIRDRDFPHFDSALRFLSLIHESTDNLISCNRYIKLTTGIKTKILINKLSQKVFDYAEVCATLNLYFPKSKLRTSGVTDSESRINQYQLHYRRLIVRLMLNTAERASYLATENEANKQLMTEIDNLLKTYMDKVNNRLTPPVIEQIGDEGPQSQICRDLQDSPDDCMDQLMSASFGGNPSEMTLLEILETCWTQEEADSQDVDMESLNSDSSSSDIFRDHLITPSSNKCPRRQDNSTQTNDTRCGGCWVDSISLSSSQTLVPTVERQSRKSQTVATTSKGSQWTELAPEMSAEPTVIRKLPSRGLTSHEASYSSTSRSRIYQSTTKPKSSLTPKHSSKTASKVREIGAGININFFGGNAKPKMAPSHSSKTLRKVAEVDAAVTGSVLNPSSGTAKPKSAHAPKRPSKELHKVAEVDAAVTKTSEINHLSGEISHSSSDKSSTSLSLLAGRTSPQLGKPQGCFPEDPGSLVDSLSRVDPETDVYPVTRIKHRSVVQRGSTIDASRKRVSMVLSVEDIPPEASYHDVISINSSSSSSGSSSSSSSSSSSKHPCCSKQRMNSRKSHKARGGNCIQELQSGESNASQSLSQTSTSPHDVIPPSNDRITSKRRIECLGLEDVRPTKYLNCSKSTYQSPEGNRTYMQDPEGDTASSDSNTQDILLFTTKRESGYVRRFPTLEQYLPKSIRKRSSRDVRMRDCTVVLKKLRPSQIECLNHGTRNAPR